MTDDEDLMARYRQWQGPPLSAAERDELDRLDTEANAVLTEAECDAALEEATFPLEVYGLSEEDCFQIQDEFDDDDKLPSPFVHHRTLIASLRRRLAAKKQEDRP